MHRWVRGEEWEGGMRNTKGGTEKHIAGGDGEAHRFQTPTERTIVLTN